MGRLTDPVARKPRVRLKKVTRGEKKKLNTKGRSPTPEHVSDPEHERDAIVPKPEIIELPMKPKAPWKKDAPEGEGYRHQGAGSRDKENHLGP